MDWATVGKIAAALVQAAYGYLVSETDATERDRKHQEMLDALRAANSSILTALVELEFATIKGMVEGVVQEYDNYDPDPDDPQEEVRLVAIIAEAADILGRLGAHIDDVTTPHNPPRSRDDEAAFRDLALNSAALTIPVLYLRAQAQMDRQFTYSAAEIKDIHGFFDLTTPRFKALVAYVHRESDRRFGQLTHRPIRGGEGEPVMWTYMFGGVAHQCLPVSAAGSRERSAKMRAHRMLVEYRKYLDGVGPVLLSATEGMERTVSELQRRRPSGRGDTHGPPGRVQSPTDPIRRGRS